MRKYFGTDGVRGIANSELDSTLAYKIGRAAGHVFFNKLKQPTVIIGKDTRKSGDMLESALSAGLMSVGCTVINAGVLPTPTIAFLTKYHNADFGVVISASHNPFEYNGIKFFNNFGYKLDDALELEIEKYIDNQDLVTNNPIGAELGCSMKKEKLSKEYIEHITSVITNKFNGLKVVLDCANGASYEVAPMAFESLGAEVIVIHDAPDGININNNCGSTHPESLQEAVLKNKADLGLAYDGDADRLIAVDEKGNIVDGDRILLLSAINLKNKNQLNKDTLVVTVMSNLGLHLAAKEHNINLCITDVGDRYVLESMQANGFNLGGEQSGHMIFLDHNTTGDGVLSSLILADIIVQENKPLSELANVMTKYPQVLVNAKVKNENKNAYTNYPEIVDEIKNIESTLNGVGRVLIRPSGTEPLVRVMLEGKDEAQLKKLATNLAKLIESLLA